MDIGEKFITLKKLIFVFLAPIYILQSGSAYACSAGMKYFAINYYMPFILAGYVITSLLLRYFRLLNNYLLSLILILIGWKVVIGIHPNQGVDCGVYDAASNKNYAVGIGVLIVLSFIVSSLKRKIK